PRSGALVPNRDKEGLAAIDVGRRVLSGRTIAAAPEMVSLVSSRGISPGLAPTAPSMALGGADLASPARTRSFDADDYAGATRGSGEDAFAAFIRAHMAPPTPSAGGPASGAPRFGASSY